MFRNGSPRFFLFVSKDVPNGLQKYIFILQHLFLTDFICRFVYSH